MITHAWVDIMHFTSSPTLFEDYFRHLVKSYPMEILRNPYSIGDGLYIVADTDIILKATKMVLTIVKSIELRTQNKMFYSGAIHISEQRSTYKSKCIQELLVRARKLEPISAIYDPIIAREKELRFEYIQNTSLKNLKRYNGR